MQASTVLSAEAKSSWHGGHGGTRFVGFVTIVATLIVTAADAQPLDTARYPDLKGAWRRSERGARIEGPAQWDPTKPPGLMQQPPLTAEYQAIFEANLAERASGGQFYNSQIRCLPGGMPRMMLAYDPLEVIVTPDITYVRTDHLSENRRIYTDGRDWPQTLKLGFLGTSIGQWRDDGGRYYVLDVETRGFKGPRQFDSSGIPFHQDNHTIIKERIYLDAADPDLLHDRITTIDHALTRPWTVVRDYFRETNPIWTEDICGEANNYLVIGKESYFRSADRLLMPTRKDQSPPDLRYFNQSSN